MAITVQAEVPGCEGRYSIARPDGTLAHFCPESRQLMAKRVVESRKSIRNIKETNIPWAERLKRRKPRSLGGYASKSGSIPRQPFPFKPVRCKEEEHNLGVRLYQVDRWFDMAINGPHNRRVLTGPAARHVLFNLRQFAKMEMASGRNKYAAAKRGENADALCAEHMIGTNKELTRVFELVKSEAAKGNRDLEDTGLHNNTSVYNK